MSSKLTKKNKIIVVLGTTASGKTGLGVYLAHKFNGEIVSADSRQVYRGMDIGTGKDLDEYVVRTRKPFGSAQGGHENPSAPLRAGTKTLRLRSGRARKQEVIKIPYHLIDVVHPRTEFNLAKYQRLAHKAIEDILSRGRVPIIAGGTGLYAQALVDGYKLDGAKPDKKLRERLEKKSAAQLLAMLKKMDAKKVQGLNESDRGNKRRLIRRIEKTRNMKHEILRLRSGQARNMKINNNYDFLILGLTWPKEVLHKRIYERLVERLEKEDMVGEVERLHKEWRVSWKRLLGFGLEYKYITLYLRGELSYDEMVEQLARAIRQFSKRQMTWLRRWEKQGVKIWWVKNKGDVGKLVSDFLG